MLTVLIYIYILDNLQDSHILAQPQTQHLVSTANVTYLHHLAQPQPQHQHQPWLILYNLIYHHILA